MSQLTLCPGTKSETLTRTENIVLVSVALSGFCMWWSRSHVVLLFACLVYKILRLRFKSKGIKTIDKYTNVAKKAVPQPVANTSKWSNGTNRSVNEWQAVSDWPSRCPCRLIVAADRSVYWALYYISMPNSQKRITATLQTLQERGLKLQNLEKKS